jgi:hypothetical protein
LAPKEDTYMKITNVCSVRFWITDLLRYIQFKVVSTMAGSSIPGGRGDKKQLAPKKDTYIKNEHIYRL